MERETLISNSLGTILLFREPIDEREATLHDIAGSIDIGGLVLVGKLEEVLWLILVDAHFERSSVIKEPHVDVGGLLIHLRSVEESIYFFGP